MSTTAAETQTPSDLQASSRRQAWIISLGLFLLTLAVFLTSTRNDFVAVGDNDYLLDNPIVLRGLSLHGVVYAFTPSTSTRYQPLSTLSHMLDVSLFGVTSAAGHHATSAILHAISASVLFVLLFLATGSKLRSSAVAAIFALHPLRVESVTWISERRDVLSVFFMLAALLGWVAFHQRGRRRFYIGAIVAFVLACLSKGQAVVLPAVLVLLWLWPMDVAFRGAWLRRAGAILPFILIAGLFAAVQSQVESSTANYGTIAKKTLHERVARASINTLDYVGDFIVPHKLAFYYPVREMSRLAGAIAIAAAAGLTIAAAIGAWKRSPIGVGWLWYVACLLPVSGLLQNGPQAAADRYTYFAQIGLAVAIVFGIPASLFARRTGRFLLAGATAAAVGALAAMTVRQVAVWKTSETLANHALAIDARNGPAHDLLGYVLFRPRTKARERDIDGAIAHFRVALGENPQSAQSLTRLAMTLAASSERAREAKDQKRERSLLNEANLCAAAATNARPKDATSRNNYAAVLYLAGQPAAAFEQWRQAVELKPDAVTFRNNFAFALVREGRFAEAVSEWSGVLAIDPDNLYARYGRGSSLAQLGRKSEAEPDLRWVAAHAAAAERGDMATQAIRLLNATTNP